MNCLVRFGRCLLVVAITLSLWANESFAEIPEIDSTRQVNRPNVVFILADDLGWRDLSHAGSEFYESPHIDRIAQEGIRFSYGYAACQVCSPSRASLMTGKYPARIKVTDWIGAPMGEDWKRNTQLLPAQYRMQLPQEETTIAEAFQAAGYTTFFAGKWHLGGEGSFPEDHGFDINIGGHHRGSPPGGFFAPFKNPKMEDAAPGTSLPIHLGQETAKFIEAQQDKRFFAFLSFYSVHGPTQTTPELWKKYREKAIKMAGDEPTESRFIVDRTTPVRQVQDNPIYAGMIESMDDAVGIVLKKLESLGLADNTIVVFTSDNGGVSAGDSKSTSNLPLRGGKGRQWEGGIREPFLIRYPKTIKPGSISEQPVIGTDLYPTLLELCGIELKPKQHVDGVSLMPIFSGRTIAPRNLFWHYPHYGNQGGEPSTIVSDGTWKLIWYHEDERSELYQIKQDIGEQTDVAKKHPGQVLRMKAQINAFLEKTDAEMPMRNSNFDEAKYAQQQKQIRTSGVSRLEKQHRGFLKADYQPGQDWWGSKVD
ncbi:MAG: sulfatase [Planctomycetota bacterium]